MQLRIIVLHRSTFAAYPTATRPLSTLIAQLQLQNFRGFDEHVLPFRARTVVVGRNNAGKSTIVEALRVLALVAARASTLPFRPPPAWLNRPVGFRGIQPALYRGQFDFQTAFHRYSDPPAIITGTLRNNAVVRVFLGPDNSVHGVLQTPDGAIVGDRGRLRSMNLPSINALPQIGPLAIQEELLTDEYVRRMWTTPLASQHFRNQIRVDSRAEQHFRSLVEETWPGVRAEQLEQLPGEPDDQGRIGRPRLQLMIRNDDFVAEAARQGHGLQMWLQTMWFLSRVTRQSSVILDEPDVYMHPDLQRRLMRFVSGRYRQVVIATHSAEIMAEVDPDDVLVVDRARRQSSFATGLPAVQKVIDALGSVHNLQLARLWSARRFLFVEGNDLALLGPLDAKLFPRSVGLHSLPHGETGGWSGWDRAGGAAATLQNAVGENIKVYALFDRDYHTPSAIARRYARALEIGTHVHIWTKKEIENFLLVPTAIARIIARRASTGRPGPTPMDVSEQIDTIIESLRSEIIAGFVTEFLLENPRNGGGPAFREAERFVESDWPDVTKRWGMASGKHVLSRLSVWSQEAFGCAFGPGVIARELNDGEVDEEINTVLTAIHEGQPFPQTPNR